MQAKRSARVFGWAVTMLVALALAAGAALAAGPTISFEAVVTYGVAASSYPWDVAFGDLDGDGDLEMVVAETGANSIGVRPGVGNGTFDFKATYTTGARPTALVIADLDRDGDLDVAVSNREDNNVTVFLGDGAGGFSGSGGFTSGEIVQGIALGDFDRDGDLDLAAACSYDDTVSVRLNDGTGVFSGSTNVAVGDSPYAVTTADVNGDGILDLIVTNMDDADVTILLGDGTGDFFASADYATDLQPLVTALGDLDRDGDLDMVTAAYGDNLLNVRMNNGSGSFAAPDDIAVRNRPHSLALGDVNDDGILDAVVAANTGDEFHVLIGSEPPAEPLIHISKTVSPTTVMPGETLTYTLVFSNTGGAAAAGVRVTDTLPTAIDALGVASSGMAVTQTSGAPAYAWNVADLAPSASGVITITGQLKTTALKGVITNTAYITASGALTNSAAAFDVSCTREITVTNTADSGPGSLRQALLDICDGGVIRFAVSTPATITLTSGSLLVDKAVAILGPGADKLAISGDDASRVLEVTALGGVAIQDLTVRDGSSNDGGGIYAAGPTALVRVQVMACQAANEGGGIYASEPLTLTQVTVAGNVSAEDGGGVLSGGSLVISASAIISNTTQNGMGGGVYSGGILVMSGSSIVGNTADGVGGGVCTNDLAEIRNTAIYSNTTHYGGGGLGLRAGDVLVADSTIAYNVAQNTDSTYGTGGGVQVQGGTKGFINVTVAHNEARGTDDDGGGGIMIYKVADTSVHLLNCTVARNSTLSTSDWGTGGGGISNDRATVYLSSTLVALNTSRVGSPTASGARLSVGGGGAPDLSGAFTSGRYNLIGDGSGATGIAQGVNFDMVGSSVAPLDPLLGSLGDHGGDTETLPLLPGSPAINAVGAVVPATDQRGVTRPQGGVRDVGAYEAQPFTLSIVGGNNQTAMINTAFALPLSVTVSSSYTEPVAGGQVWFMAPQIGASAVVTPAVAVIGADGSAACVAVANGQVGVYNVFAGSRGVSASGTFTLTNGVHTPTPTNTATPTPTLTPTPTIAPAAQYSSAVQFGPDELCPGYNLYYTVFITNTNLDAALPNIVVTATAPAGTWFFGEAGGMPFTYDGTHVVWRLDSLPAGQTARAELTLHSSSGLPNGQVITTTFQHQCGPLEARADVATSMVDTTACGSLPEPTATYEPTPTHTPVITPTPTPEVTPTYTPEPQPTIPTLIYLPLALK